MGYLLSAEKAVLNYPRTGQLRKHLFSNWMVQETSSPSGRLMLEDTNAKTSFLFIKQKN